MERLLGQPHHCSFRGVIRHSCCEAKVTRSVLGRSLVGAAPCKRPFEAGKSAICGAPKCTANLPGPKTAKAAQLDLCGDGDLGVLAAGVAAIAPGRA